MAPQTVRQPSILSEPTAQLFDYEHGHFGFINQHPLFCAMFSIANYSGNEDQRNLMSGFLQNLAKTEIFTDPDIRSQSSYLPSIFLSCIKEADSQIIRYMRSLGVKLAMVGANGVVFDGRFNHYDNSGFGVVVSERIDQDGIPVYFFEKDRLYPSPEHEQVSFRVGYLPNALTLGLTSQNKVPGVFRQMSPGLCSIASMNESVPAVQIATNAFNQNRLIIPPKKNRRPEPRRQVSNEIPILHRIIYGTTRVLVGLALGSVIYQGIPAATNFINYLADIKNGAVSQIPCTVEGADEGLNLRDQPDSSSKVITVLKNGQLVQWTGERKDVFNFVITGENQRGYASNIYLKCVPKK